MYIQFFTQHLNDSDKEGLAQGAGVGNYVFLAWTVIFTVVSHSNRSCQSLGVFSDLMK